MGVNNFDLPGIGFFEKISFGVKILNEMNPDISLRDVGVGLFEVIAPICLAIQSVYLFLRPKIGSPVWKFGIGFAVLFWFLGEAVMASQIAYARAVLPLTFAANLLIYQYESGKRYFYWYIAINLGMSGGALRFIYDHILHLPA